MRTIAYVDGYNLYFGCLKGTPYKWLDLVRLIGGILAIQDPQARLIQTKYFTAPIKARLASRGAMATQAQQDYHRALKARGNIEIVEGWYSLERSSAPRLVDPPNKSDRVEIWRLEEKETDVAIALQVYRDCLRGECDQVVLVSSDSDLVPALRLIRADAPAVSIGLILPRSGGSSRPPNTGLSNLAHWTRGEIQVAELAAAQLPARVPTAKRPVCKPDYW